MTLRHTHVRASIFAALLIAAIVPAHGQTAPASRPNSTMNDEALTLSAFTVYTLPFSKLKF